MTQLGLKLRDEAIDRVASTHAAFVARVCGWIAVLPPGHCFTSDEIWRRHDELPASLQPREPRAMGAALKHAARLGLIESAGRYVKSTRPECHARPVLVWRRS